MVFMDNPTEEEFKKTHERHLSRDLFRQIDLANPTGSRYRRGLALKWPALFFIASEPHLVN